MTLHGQVRAWIADDVDPAAAAELQALLDAGDDANLADRFAAPLAFGTAGLRGPLRAGPNGMNRTVVRRTAAGLAAWLSAQGRLGEPVIVGYDARHGSADFAHDSAAIFAAAGFDARLLPGQLPTPVLAFAVQHLHAAAGVMVTASHNPPQDNGYKVYAADGAQIVPPADAEIEAAIEAVGASRAISLDEAAITHLGPTNWPTRTSTRWCDSSRPARASCASCTLPCTASAPTRCAGCCRPPVSPTSCPSRSRNGPTPTSPPSRSRIPKSLARSTSPSTSPAASTPTSSSPTTPMPTGARSRCRARTGPGGCCAATRWACCSVTHCCAAACSGTYATTIVSSSMLGAIARRHHAGYAETLTGFKWISRAAPDLVYGYEEALGYAVAPDLVRDKDGVSAALRVAELAAALRAGGSSLPARLDELAGEYGRYATDQVSIRVDDLSVIEQTMSRLRTGPPTSLLGAPVAVDDLLPDADVLRWRWSGTPDGRVVVRPSGTEPKLKAYLEVMQPDGDAAVAAAALQQLAAEVRALL